MREPDWTQGGATIPTVLATLSSFLAAPLGGLGVIIALFGAWIPAAAFSTTALLLWFGGRWLLDRQDGSRSSPQLFARAEA
jgi:hypothetical protein